MEESQTKKTIVVSAVGLNRGGTLTILRDCLNYLSSLNQNGRFRIVAVVYDRALADYPHVEYIETKWPKQRWINRLWYEYVSMKKISKQLAPVYLWFSLHDTSPNVLAERRAVYCHNAFSFYKWKWREWIFAPKIVLFALLTKYIYRINIHKNRYVVVQQEWFRKAFLQQFRLDAERVVVAPPDLPPMPKAVATERGARDTFRFIYPAIADSHKNFECLAEATRLLQAEGVEHFEVLITVGGGENAYAKWLHRKWGQVPQLRFVGYMDRATLFSNYDDSQCLVFPSKVETWGLPITEFATLDKPMLLADLPYARETAAGCAKVGFFDPDSPAELAGKMKMLLRGQHDFLKPVPERPIGQPRVANWEQLFGYLLHDSPKVRAQQTVH